MESADSANYRSAKPGLRGWVKLGMVAAASALAGGLAAAWFYRKTLNTLRNAELEREDSEFRIPDTETEFDI